MDKLMNAAKEVMKNSYSPYSNFKVGAAVKTKDGKIYVGTNVENASYGGTICAERVALTHAISEGCQPGDFDEIAVIGQTSDAPTAPCNLCRQVMLEFCNDETKVTFANENGQSTTVTLGELSPYPFRGKDLN
jgi:cytidine deaminase